MLLAARHLSSPAELSLRLVTADPEDFKLSRQMENRSSCSHIAGNFLLNASHVSRAPYSIKYTFPTCWGSLPAERCR